MQAEVQNNREQRLLVAQKAFRDFYAQCFWSYDPQLTVTEDLVPLIIRELRLNGGHKGYRIVAELHRLNYTNPG
jgi:hypothetical protein